MAKIMNVDYEAIPGQAGQMRNHGQELNHETPAAAHIDDSSFCSGCTLLACIQEDCSKKGRRGGYQEPKGYQDGDETSPACRNIPQTESLYRFL